MVKLQQAREAVLSSAFSTKPTVAVFVGGTSGIGHYTLRALVRSRSDDGKDLKVYLVGRNSTAADEIKAECQAIKPGVQIQFVKADDLSLLTGVDQVCANINELEGESGRIDLLVMSQGGLYLKGREGTKEGLPLSMALHCYSRVRFIERLLPLLLRSTATTTSTSCAHIVSVYVAGMESKLMVDDLSLQKPDSYSFDTARSHCLYIMTLYFEEMACRHPGKLSFVHVFPGLVITPGFKINDHPMWFKAVMGVTRPLMKLVATPDDEAGDRVLFLATDSFPARSADSEEGGESSDGASKTQAGLPIAVASDGKLGGGAYACNMDGETVPYAKHSKKYQSFDRKDLTEKIMSHLTKLSEEAEAGKAFEG